MEFQVALLELHKPSARMLTLIQAFTREKCYAEAGHAIQTPASIQVDILVCRLDAVSLHAACPAGKM